ncbi:MAG: hypothetical protein NTV89_00185 [Proteobacteria bacterium]|nr:hypothetical protein [Pseudomonadota bacterium]
MSKAHLVMIKNLAVRKSDIDKVKKAFRVKDNTEAVIKALDLATGKIELETIFEKHRGTRITKVYA